MDLESIMLSERSLRNKMMNKGKEVLRGKPRNRLLSIENKFMVTRGGGGGKYEDR